MQKKCNISPYTAALISVWLVWVLITFTERVYYSDDPGKVFYIWMKVRSLQGLNGMLATFVLFLVYQRLAPKELPLAVKVLGVILITYGFSLGLVLVNYPIYSYFFNKVPIFPSWNTYLVIAFSKFFIILLLSILYFLITYLKELQRQKEQTLKALATAKEARLEMLRYQLNPHFLFNALNSIRTLVYKDIIKAAQMITDLSEFLRYTLANKDEHEVSLKDEIDVINNYLDIQKIRFESKLSIHINIEAKAQKVKIPCFLLHPLVENAVKYGLESSPPPLKINIKGAVKQDTLEVKIQNSGLLSHPKDVRCNGTGLKNVKMRLNHLFPEKHSFELFQESKTVSAVIRIYMGT